MTDKSYARALADMGRRDREREPSPARRDAGDQRDRNELIELLQAQLDALRDLTDRD